MEELTPRQLSLVKNYTDPESDTYGNMKRSAMKAGYDEGYADRITGDIPQKVRKSLVEAMEARGMTVDFLSQRHQELLNKREVIISGKEVKLTDQPHSDVKGALDMAYKLRGDYSPEKHQHSGDLKHYVISVAEDTDNPLQEPLGSNESPEI